MGEIFQGKVAISPSLGESLRFYICPDIIMNSISFHSKKETWFQ